MKSLIDICLQKSYKRCDKLEQQSSLQFTDVPERVFPFSSLFPKRPANNVSVVQIDLTIFTLDRLM